MSHRVRLGELLVEAHIVTREQLDEVLRRQTNDPRRLGILLVEAGLLTETEVTQILSQQLSVPWVSLYHVDFSRQLLNLVPQEIAERYGVVPIFVRRVRGLGQTLYVAMEDPSDEAAIAAVAEYSGLPVRAMIAPPSEIRAAIRAYYTSASLRPVQPLTPSGQRPVEPRSPAAVHVLPSIGRALSSPMTVPSGDGARVGAPAAPVTTAAPSEPMVPGEAVPAPDPPASALSDGVAASSSAAAPDALPASISRPDHADSDALPLPAAPSLRSITNSPAEAGDATASTNAAQASAVGDTTALNSRRPTMPEPRRGAAHRMITLTLLDGTEIRLPARVGSAEGVNAMPGEQLTARDMVAALRAAVNGADASQILGDNPRWERLVAALLAVLLRKHLIADWEFIDEYNKSGGE
jgi:type IV pilus assembly protein PilB